jgi:hypothetical protein
MKRGNVILLRDVIDELANSLQVAIGLAARVRRHSQASAVDASQLEASIARAVAALKRLEPPRRGAR